MIMPGPARGTLWLVPNTLDLGSGETSPLAAVLPAAVIERAAGLGHWVVEDARSARAFLKRVGESVPLARPLQAMDIQELPRPRKGSGETVPAAAWLSLLAPALAGSDVGLLSEAGLPAVADPGSALVAAAHERGVPVVALPGPSSLLLALAASGLDGQSFAFAGYLPQDAAARRARIQQLEQVSIRQHQTQIVIETPYRNAALMSALLEALQPGTRLAVGCGIGLAGGFSLTRRVADWRRDPPAWPERLPAVFCWLGG